MSTGKVTLPHNTPTELLVAMLRAGLGVMQDQAPQFLRSYEELAQHINAYPGQFVACSWSEQSVSLDPKETGEIDEKALLPKAHEQLETMLRGGSLKKCS